MKQRLFVVEQPYHTYCEYAEAVVGKKVVCTTQVVGQARVFWFVAGKVGGQSRRAKSVSSRTYGTISKYMP